MPAFTTESLVRAKFQLNDTTLVPAALITTSIADAHAELLRFLDPDCVGNPPDAALVMGETILAGAHVYRSLASCEAFTQKRIAVGGQRIEDSARFASLMAIAALAEEQAWYIVEPYLLDIPSRLPAALTDTTPIFAED